MNKHQLDLYQRIQAFDFDKVDVKTTFNQRLQREHRWSTAYTVRVVEEYRKFLFLTMSAGHKVYPSDQVDQSWHLHLTNSRSYWDELCPKILGKNLHHEANPGGRSEQINHHHGYKQTLASYELIFGQTPPEDIWPSVELRFGRDVHFVRVNSSRNWIIKKPDINFKGLCSPVFLITLSLFLVGCGTYGLEDLNDVAKQPRSYSEVFFYTLLILLLEFGLFCLLNMIDKCFAYFLRNKTRSTPLTTDELAYLRGGYKGILELSMVKSVQQFYSDPTVDRTADIAAYWQGQTINPQYKCLQEKIVEKQLFKKGLLTPTPSFFLMVSIALIMNTIPYFNMVYIAGNIQRDIIFFIVFVISLVGQFLVALPFTDDHPCTITGTCKQMLNEKQTQIESKICELQLLQGKLTGEQLNEAVAIMGLDALRYSEFPELAGLLNGHISSTLLQSTSGNKSGHNDSGDTGGGCSSYDSGSSGCGGCGGCGGGGD